MGWAHEIWQQGIRGEEAVQLVLNDVRSPERADVDAWCCRETMRLEARAMREREWVGTLLTESASYPRQGARLRMGEAVLVVLENDGSRITLAPDFEDWLPGEMAGEIGLIGMPMTEAEMQAQMGHQLDVLSRLTL